jgi:hypothetical protein
MAELGYLALVAHGIPDSVGIAGLVYWRLATWMTPMMVGAILMGVHRSRRGWRPRTGDLTAACSRPTRLALRGREGPAAPPSARDSAEHQTPNAP